MRSTCSVCGGEIYLLIGVMSTLNLYNEREEPLGYQLDYRDGEIIKYAFCKKCRLMYNYSTSSEDSEEEEVSEETVTRNDLLDLEKEKL